MSADTLRRAAALLRERADAATPGPWSAADEYGLIPEADPAWCISQMRPGYQSMSPTEGYVGDVAEVWCERKDACPDADYIATMHPGVGLALADWLDLMAWQHETFGQNMSGFLLDHSKRAEDVARLILGATS